MKQSLVIGLSLTIFILSSIYFISQSTIDQRALSYAAKKHAGQMRRDGTEYIFHPIRVSEKLKDYGVTDEIITSSALLHDTLEDTNATLEELRNLFGEEVANTVSWLTTDKAKMEELKEDQTMKMINNGNCETMSIFEGMKSLLPEAKKEAILKRQAKALYMVNKLKEMYERNRRAFLVKLSDRLDNINSCITAEDDRNKPEVQFMIEYYLETKFMIDNLSDLKIEEASVEESLLNEIQNVLNKIESQLNNH